ncbi:helix-turn-helix transcriptional regulator [Leptospira interrogans]|uniref:helix-turn-helix domain-containing protein n=2 Tax=Leptospira interrogans TaxID=173 RepID=UPI001F100168|nr:helix-turn-helix transcriptional regulator [Leptospira interrogans]UMQ53416.1 helix-turn-helix transcriptional regulator [Leptospira interrogans]UMQ53993.1 helix-turn-helix transcriptional regulator [Leptospira interrogans]UMQ54375.1 helix-turn-helix transcriptional regulator [Leptospira interrogans]UMQ54387.1 helix-turn-helix transcriptional regulator [Leptospira interrogans]
MASKQKKNQKDQFPERLRQLRVTKKMSQEELGQLTDLNYNHIGRYERGDSRPSADKLKALADALGVTTDYLLDGNSDNAARVNIEDQELLEMFKKVQELPQEKKESIKDLIEAYLFREKVRKDIYVITK